MGRKNADASLIAAAAEWRLISLLLERPRAGWHAEVARVAAEVKPPALRKAAAAAQQATEGEYLALLGPGGAVSPRAVTYRPFADPGHLLAELSTVYQAFAFHPRAEEPIDHIAVEAGFAGYLLLKEAFATARGDREAATTTAAARRDFIATHVAAVVAPFAERLETAGQSYLVHAARCLVGRVAAPPRRPGGIPTDVDELSTSCSACPAR